MQDIDLIREHPQKLIDDLKKRKADELVEVVKETKSLDQEWRHLKHREDELRHKRNKVSESINRAKKAGEDIQPLIKEAKQYPENIAEVNEERTQLQQKISENLRRLPNITHDSVPYGESDEDNAEIRRWGEPEEKDFELLPHQEVAEQLGVADFERSAKISGAGFYFLRGDLALLNQSLIRFAIDQLVRKNYEYVEPPLMMNREAYETGVSMDDFEDVMYKLQDEQKHLIATSEAPLLAQYMDDELREDELPIRMVGYSMCFRKEVGSHGIDTKGLFRTHQFNKVEQVVVCKPEDSWKILEELQANAEYLHKALELPYRVVNCCTGDLGNFAAKKYDIEAWMPRQETYRETTSTSNYTDYQARRANVRYHEKDTNSYKNVHTLNATALATSRIMVAILENYQNKDGSVTIPKVLRPYMFGRSVIR